jgi:hypothetical protein
MSKLHLKISTVLGIYESLNSPQGNVGFGLLISIVLPFGRAETVALPEQFTFFNDSPPNKTCKLLLIEGLKCLLHCLQCKTGSIGWEMNVWTAMTSASLNEQ